MPGDTSNGSAKAEPSNAVDAVKTKKQPPPETPQGAWTRRAVIIAFWSVVLLLGLPIWWKTTTVYRASLPLRAMTDWAEGKVCNPVFPLRVELQVPSLTYEDAQHLLRLAQHSLDDLNDFSAHHLRLSLYEPAANSTDAKNGIHGAINSDTVALTINMTPAEGTGPIAKLHPYLPILEVTYPPTMVPTPSSTSSALGTFLAGKLQDIFGEEQAILAHLLASPSSSPAKALPPDIASRLSRRQTRSVKYAPTYHLTFSMFTPEAAPSDWDIEAALEENFAPLLESLSPISNFTIDTQVQPYATFAPSVQPVYDSQRKSWVLKMEDLGGFINAAEWPLSPSIGTGPTINFVLYVPSQALTPLIVDQSTSNSWLVPQWGGVYIHNRKDGRHQRADRVSKEELRTVMVEFSQQLTSLLGFPETSVPLSLRLSTLARVRAASLLFSAASTMGSLARLTHALPSISIPDSVARSVDITVEHLRLACDSFREGAFHRALDHGRIAETEAEKAFFEPSMVGQVYFPEEHKVAVYLPLLGPVAVPLVLAAVRELKQLRNRRKTNAR